MIKAGLDALDGPSVILLDEVHKTITKDLAAATAGIGEKEVGLLWKAYKKVYKANPEWLKAIAHYFGE